jgi:hypothetical protein
MQASCDEVAGGAPGAAPCLEHGDVPGVVQAQLEVRARCRPVIIERTFCCISLSMLH